VPQDTGIERVEGDDAFVRAALAGEQEREARRSRLRRDGWTPPRVVDRAAEVCGVSPDQVYGPGKRPAQVRGRALASKLGHRLEEEGRGRESNDPKGGPDG
jgi:hypothetical protein